MINLAEESLENQLVKRLTELEKQMREIKTRQLIGGDNTVVEGTNILFLSDTFTSGQVRFYYITLTPDSEILGMPQLLSSYWIDVDATDNSLHPNATLTNDQLAVDFEERLDYARSFDAIGERVWVVRIENFGATTRTVYARWRIYQIKNPAGTA